MFRRALRLGSRVAVASTAAVVPATAAACLSDSNTTYKCGNQQSPDAQFWSAVARASTDLAFMIAAARPPFRIWPKPPSLRH